MSRRSSVQWSTLAGTASDGTDGVLDEPVHHVLRVAAVTTRLAPAKPLVKSKNFIYLGYF